MGDRLRGRAALVTGGTSGIGAATARLFAAEGAKVAVVGRDETRGREVAESCGGGAVFIRADVTREAEIAAAIAGAIEAFGALDILFNNAGGRTAGDLEDVTEDGFRAAMDLNLGSAVFGMKHAAPHMKARGWGRIINNASIAGLRTDYGGYLYSAAKAGVAQITRMAGMRLAPYGITVNSISPGGIATPIFFGGSDIADEIGREHAAAKMRKLEANLARATPALKAGRPEDIAEAALFLASEGGRFVNCHDLVVDAGMVAGGRTDYSANRP